MFDFIFDWLVPVETTILHWFGIVMPCIDLIADHGGICFA